MKGIPVPEDVWESASEVPGITTVVRASIKLQPNNSGDAASSTHGVCRLVLVIRSEVPISTESSSVQIPVLVCYSHWGNYTTDGSIHGPANTH
jgi:hypothetical protein